MRDQDLRATWPDEDGGLDRTSTRRNYHAKCYAFDVFVFSVSSFGCGSVLFDGSRGRLVGWQLTAQERQATLNLMGPLSIVLTK